MRPVFGFTQQSFAKFGKPGSLETIRPLRFQMRHGEKRKGKKKKKFSCDLLCRADTCHDLSPHFSNTPGVSHTERSARHLSSSEEEKHLRVTQSVVQRGSLCWWEMTSSTGLWLESLQIRVKYSSYWLVWLHPSLWTVFSWPSGWECFSLSLPFLLLSLFFICSPALLPLNKLQGRWWQQGGRDLQGRVLWFPVSQPCRAPV